MSARRGLQVAPFDELAEPAVVADLAARAEDRGWDGFFLWDHLIYRAPVRALANPWVTLAAMAVRTQKLLLGPMVTPIPRRRPHQLARETVSLDRLSGGRLILGVGIGSDRSGEFDRERFGEEPDPKSRGVLLDDGLERLQAYWDGEFEPRPLSRIPIWVAVSYPNQKPLRRAARYDGVFPINLPGPEALAEMPSKPGFELVVAEPDGTDWAPWEAAGATWCLTGFSSSPTIAEVEAAIDAL
jgi:alkanesulfonate monooxygenase SsuD/methylene tetrahydromethanopterin reductase-like flavin-dependent oxidoreductase (luciferase family)